MFTHVATLPCNMSLDLIWALSNEVSSAPLLFYLPTTDSSVPPFRHTEEVEAEHRKKGMMEKGVVPALLRGETKTVEREAAPKRVTLPLPPLHDVSCRS